MRCQSRAGPRAREQHTGEQRQEEPGGQRPDKEAKLGGGGGAAAPAPSTGKAHTELSSRVNSAAGTGHSRSPDDRSVPQLKRQDG